MLMDAAIPSGFSDHHMITIDIHKNKQLLDCSIIGILIKNII